MLGQPTPANIDPEGDFYAFEKGVEKSGAAKGSLGFRREAARRAGPGPGVRLGRLPARPASHPPTQQHQAQHGG
jgi:hypothetical protein